MRSDEFPIIDKYVNKEINRVLDALRAEIEELKPNNPNFKGYFDQNVALNKALKVIDKYKKGGADCESTSEIKETET